MRSRGQRSQKQRLDFIPQTFRLDDPRDREAFFEIYQRKEIPGDTKKGTKFNHAYFLHFQCWDTIEGCFGEL